uniref:Uncharacterized protein n=1 Tax=Glossina palpalis gambiensis TaxID=67801 RepID=A0A1B0C530_9MUSC
MRKILKIVQLKNIYVENIPKVQQQQLHKIITLDLHHFQTWSSSLESSLVVLFSLHIALKIFKEPSFLLISEFCNHFIIVDSLTRFGGDFLHAEAENLVPLEDLVSLTQNLPSGVYQMTACLRDKTLQSNMALFSAALLLAIKRPTMHSTFDVRLMFCGDPLLRSHLMLPLCPIDLEDLTAAQLLPLSYQY